MKIIDDISKVDIEQWNALLQSSSTKNIFQTQMWFDFCAKQALFETFIYGIVDDNDILKGVIVGYVQKEGRGIKGILTRRAIIIGGPLFSNNISDYEVSTLFKSLINGLKNKVIYIEIRNLLDYSIYKKTIIDSGFTYVPHLNFHIDTSSSEVVTKNLHRNKKRQIKSSENQGVIIEPALSKNDVETFYKMLKRMYIERVKTPLPSYSFFESLYNEKFAKFLIVKKDSKIIGGLVVLTLEKDTIYQYYMCGEDGIYPNVYPSVMATYAGINYAITNGCAKCDLMGAGRPDEDYGVRNFKAGFGGQLVEHGRYCFVYRPLLYEFGKLGVKLLRKFK
ncbi:MAG: peptidoglycan bridge formation glycyltransferase FemA/FemB family protein [Bacteroidales bacterium]|nr:peptidoglycan bridge formation glycyltransferase FemA/FemB family protein [Bacteroidales bacterium]